MYVRATADPAGRRWDDRVTVVEPGALHTDTCSYAALLPLGDDTALIAYSEFNLPGPEGRSCKGIRVRTVAATRNPLPLGSRRELFVDDYLIERLEDTRWKLHEPVSDGVVLRIDIMDNNLFIDCSRGVSGGWNPNNSVWRRIANHAQPANYYTSDLYLERYAMGRKI